jgi:hypothetical protein
LDDGDHTGFHFTPSETKALRPFWKAVKGEPSKAIYRWQRRALAGDDLEVWLNVRDTKRLLGVVGTAWDENWSLPHLSPQDNRHISVPVTEILTRCFRDFETAKLFNRAKRKISHFGRPAMCMSIF